MRHLTVFLVNNYSHLSEIMKFSNLKIGTRILMGFAVVLVFLFLTALNGLSSMSDIETRLKTITEVNNVQIDEAAKMRYTVMDLMVAARNVVLLTEPAEMQPEVDRMTNDFKTYRDTARQMDALVTDAGEREQLAALAALEQEIEVPLTKAAKLGLANENQQATAVLLHEVRPIQYRWVAALNAFIDMKKKRNAEYRLDASAKYATARAFVWGLAAVALVFGVATALLTARSITRPLARALEVADRVAAGDLSAHIDLDRKDEVGQLLASLRTMNGNLHDIVVKIRSGTDALVGASDEIANGNLDLSARTEHQAGALEETASSMEQLAAAVAQNADHARDASAMAVAASDVAHRGGEVVERVVRTMETIEGSARQIADIISVIDGIAFQTNILALNAAVEAARAGEEGRGFAVVASEVRNLAQRSATAAKEIAGLISGSVAQITQGTTLAAEAGATIRDVVASVTQVSGAVGAISEATQEQKAGIGQVNQAVSDMDGMTQQNAALVEEAAAAAASLRDQANDLARMVSAFKLGDGARHAAHGAQPARNVRALAVAVC
jgi:methyl-accepting chemotaxis protein